MRFLSSASLAVATQEAHRNTALGALDVLRNLAGHVAADAAYRFKPHIVDWRKVEGQLHLVVEKVKHFEEVNLRDKSMSSLARLQNLIRCLSPTSGECERQFSLVNIFHTDLRNRLSIATVRDIMFLNATAADPFVYPPAEDAEVLINTGLGKKAACTTFPQI